MTVPDIREKFGKGMVVAAFAALIGASASNIFGVLGWGAQHLREADLSDTATAVRLKSVESQIVQIASDDVQRATQTAALDARMGEITSGIRDMRADLVRRTEVLVALRSLAEETRGIVQVLNRPACPQQQCDRIEEVIRGWRMK